MIEYVNVCDNVSVLDRTRLLVVPELVIEERTEELAILDVVYVVLLTETIYIRDA